MFNFFFLFFALLLLYFGAGYGYLLPGTGMSRCAGVSGRAFSFRMISASTYYHTRTHNAQLKLHVQKQIKKEEN